MDGWDSFLVAQAGAAAAFAGLVLVSISINLDRILQGPTLIERSAEPLVILFTLFVSSSLMLIPGQATWVYGVELLIVAILFSIAIGKMLHQQRRTLRENARAIPAPKHSFSVRVTLCVVTAGCLLLGGLLIALGYERGLYALAPAMFAGFLLAFLDAWVLLIEIDR